MNSHEDIRGWLYPERAAVLDRHEHWPDVKKVVDFILSPDYSVDAGVWYKIIKEKNES